MAARQPRLDRHQFEQALGVGEGQGSLACFSPWGHKESEHHQQSHKQLNKAIVFEREHNHSKILIAVV